MICSTGEPAGIVRPSRREGVSNAGRSAFQRGTIYDAPGPPSPLARRVSDEPCRSPRVSTPRHNPGPAGARRRLPADLGPQFRRRRRRRAPMKRRWRRSPRPCPAGTRLSARAGVGRRALAFFAKWSDAFEPVAELDHAYLSTDETLLRATRPEAAQWKSHSSKALEFACTEGRHGRGSFAEARPASRVRDACSKSQLPSSLPPRLPHASESASHRPSR